MCLCAPSRLALLKKSLLEILQVGPVLPDSREASSGRADRPSPCARVQDEEVIGALRDNLKAWVGMWEAGSVMVTRCRG